MKAEDQPNDVIRARRESLGLSEVSISEKCGLSIMEYHDLEAYPDEAFSALKLENILCVCDQLGLKIGELFNWESDVSQLTASEDQENFIIRCRRIRGLSVTELSDASGVKEEGIVEAEADVSALLTWPIEFVKALADALQVPPMDLIAAVRRYASS